MNFLIASILLLSHQAEPLQAMDLGLGIGVIRQDLGIKGFGGQVFGGAVLELSYAQKIESLWLEFGLSGLFGGGLGMTSGLSNDEIRGGGFHIDAGYSLLRSRYVDLKLGVGAGAKYLRRLREENWMDSNFGYHLESRSTRNVFQICSRGMVALNFHGQDGIGGLEFRPIKGELGPSFFDITPSLAIYWPL